jgi:hypothetical protein
MSVTVSFSVTVNVRRQLRVTVFLPARMGGLELDFTRYPIAATTRQATREERGFDKGHGTRLAAQKYIQESLTSFLNLNQATPKPNSPSTT